MAKGTTIIGAFSMLLIMTYMHYQLAIRSFKMINELPDRVVRWFGQGGEQLGEAEEANRTTGLFVSQSENRLNEMGRGFQAQQDINGKGDAPTKADDPNSGPSKGNINDTR